MQTTGWLFIGVGGVGMRLADRCYTHCQTKDSNDQVARLVIDVDMNDLHLSATRPARETFLIPGHGTIADCIARLDPESDLYKQVVAVVHPSFQRMSLSEGTGQIYELGKMVSILSGGDLLRAVNAAADTLEVESVNIALLGSLAGGLGSALIPILAGTLRQDPELSARLGTIAGYAISSACFSAVVPRGQHAHIAKNEQNALAELGQMKDPFDIFEVIGRTEGVPENEQLGSAQDRAFELVKAEVNRA